MNQIYTMALLLNLALGLILSLVVFFCCEDFMGLMKVNESQIGDAVTYTKIVGIFLFLQAFWQYRAISIYRL